MVLQTNTSFPVTRVFRYEKVIQTRYGPLSRSERVRHHRCYMAYLVFAARLAFIADRKAMSVYRDLFGMKV